MVSNWGPSQSISFSDYNICNALGEGGWLYIY